MSDEFKRLIEREMEDEYKRIMEEVNSNPELTDVHAPPDIREALFEQIRAYEEEKTYERLSEKQKEWIQLGKNYQKRQKWNRIALVAVALIGLVAYGTVSIGEGKSIFSMLSQKLAGGEQVTVDSEDVETIIYVDENEAYDEFEKAYEVSLVKLNYLPKNTVFCEAIIGREIQNLNMIYEIDGEAKIIYSIRPNYREGSIGSVIEDEKIQEYRKKVNNVEVVVAEFRIVETGENRWSVCFEYGDVQYLLRITDMEQGEVEKIIQGLSFLTNS